MRFATAIYFLLLSTICSGQSSEFFKVWLGTADYRIENILILSIKEDYPDSIVDDQFHGLEFESANGEIDTSYYPLKVVFRINENHSINYKVLGEPEQNLSWSKISNNEILIDFDDKMVARLDSTNHISLVIYDHDTVSRVFGFRPIEMPHKKINHLDLQTILMNNSWRFIDPNSYYRSSEFVFEKDSLTVSIHKDDSSSYLSKARWIIDSFENHRFIFINGNYHPFYLHLTDIVNSGEIDITAIRYSLDGFPFETQPPQLVEYHLVSEPILSKSQYDSLSRLIVGKWKSGNLSFNFDEDHLERKATNSFLTYKFKKNGTVDISMTAKRTDQANKSDLTKTEQLRWRLSKNGRLLVLEIGQNQQEIAAVSFLNADALEVTKDMESFEGYNMGQMTFELTRQR